jgi:hypothetical protein
VKKGERLPVVTAPQGKANAFSEKEEMTTGNLLWRRARGKVRRGESLNTEEVGVLLDVNSVTVSRYVREERITGIQTTGQGGMRYLFTPEAVCNALGFTP